MKLCELFTICFKPVVTFIFHKSWRKQRSQKTNTVELRLKELHQLEMRIKSYGN